METIVANSLDPIEYQNLRDSDGNLIDVTTLINPRLRVVVKQGKEFERRVDFTDSDTGQLFGKTFRVIVGDTNLPLPLYFMPSLLSTSVRSVTAYKGRGNKHSIFIYHNGEPVPLDLFDRFVLYGLNDGGIDSAVNPEVFEVTTRTGEIVLDVGQLITSKMGNKTTLVGFTEDEAEGLILWDYRLAEARVDFSIVEV